MKDKKMYGHGGKAQGIMTAATLPSKSKRKKPAFRRGRGGRAMGGQMYAEGGIATAMTTASPN